MSGYVMIGGLHSVVPKGCMTQQRSNPKVLGCLEDVIKTVYHRLNQCQGTI